MAKKGSKKSSKKKAAKKTKKKVAKKKITAVTKIEEELQDIEKEIVYDSGKLSFVFGIVISIILGVFLAFFNPKITVGVGLVYAILIVLGLIVGIINITMKETREFLLASLVFLSAATIISLNLTVVDLTLPQFGALIRMIFINLALFVAPAATVVAIKSIYQLAKN